VCGPAAASSSHHMPTLLSGVVFGEIKLADISPVAIPYRMPCQSSHLDQHQMPWRHPKRSRAFRRLLLAKASACGIPRFAELARPLVWCIVLNAGREHRISINKNRTVGRNNKLTNQPKTYPSKRLQHIKP
jgi:hypothetical protein